MRRLRGEVVFVVDVEELVEGEGREEGGKD